MNENIRRLFPVTKNYIYLNHAAASPVSLPVYERITAHARDILDSGLANWREWGGVIEKAREQAALLVNAQPSQIAFTPNTSTGISTIANGIAWRAGDNVVTADCEFPANLSPWIRLEQERGIEVRKATEVDGRIELASILDLVNERTRVVALSFVEFASGFRNDLRSIGHFCRERDVLFVVDAIQGLGALKLDVIRDHVDAFSADAHKFLLGPEGAGLLYAGPRALAAVKPSVVGWMSFESPFSFGGGRQEYVAGARRFEPGTLNVSGIVGLGAALELFHSVGVELIEEYLLSLSSYLGSCLDEKGYEVVSSRRPGETSSIVCCRHARHSSNVLSHALEEKRIITTARMGRLRLSPHFYNTRDDIDQLIDALPG
ncbi:MAG: aminotransferase class V-fold PLP-dependent enzyme [Acidobacteriota bacterium]